ncbi:MAG: hypothetical protein ACRCXZ_04630, partial [Patescibacteria group bacterium]
MFSTVKNFLLTLSIGLIGASSLVVPQVARAEAPEPSPSIEVTLPTCQDESGTWNYKEVFSKSDSSKILVDCNGVNPSGDKVDLATVTNTPSQTSVKGCYDENGQWKYMTVQSTGKSVLMDCNGVDPSGAKVIVDG